MGRPKFAGRNMSPRHIRARNFERDAKKAEIAKERRENKKAGRSRRIPIDPTIPSWKHGFFTAIHSFLVAHDLDNYRKSVAAESSGETPETIVNFQADASGIDAQTEESRLR
uniref:Uncharacterized protein n=1 Tax=Solanum tuberosum TaxID=4113 RepID=M1D814_SOLTU